MTRTGGSGRSRRPLGGRDDERVAPVDRDVHVVQAQRFPDHPRREVVVHRQRGAHGRAGVGHGVGPVVDRHVSQAGARHAELVDVARGPGGVADRSGDGLRLGDPGAAERGAAPERVLQRAARVPGHPVGPVIGEHHVAEPAVHGADGGGHVVAERDHRIGEPGHLRDPQHVLHRRGAGQRPAQAVDVPRRQAALAEHGLAGLGDVARLAPVGVAGLKPGRGGAGDRHPVLHGVARGDHAAPSWLSCSARRNTGMGAPPRVIQSSSTRRPIWIPSFGDPTTVLENRSPGCSSRSTVTTG